MNGLVSGRAHRPHWWIGVLLVAFLLLAACGTSSTNGAGGNAAPTATATSPAATATTPAAPIVAQVKINEKSERYGFSPAMLTVAKGTKVIWTNASDAPHTVTSDSGTALDSPTIARSGGKFSFTFTEPGTYTYHCTIHPYMTGTIVVTG
jgi:plastocyanin